MIFFECSNVQRNVDSREDKTNTDEHTVKRRSVPLLGGIRSYSLFLTRVLFQYVVQSLDKTYPSFTF